MNDWYAAHPEERRAAQARYRAAHSEKVRADNTAYRAANREKRRVYNVAWHTANPGKGTAYQNMYTDKHPGLVREKSAARRVRTTTLLSKLHQVDIRAFYSACPLGHHVDHQIPLRGKTVSGLHVPWNLQYLPAAENRRKYNSYCSERGLS